MRWNIIQKYRIALRIYTVIKYHALIAQLDRASGYGPEGWEFESLWVHQAKTTVVGLQRSFFNAFVGNRYSISGHDFYSEWSNVDFAFSGVF